MNTEPNQFKQDHVRSSRGGWTPEEERAILETVKENCRNEGRRDALVNLKKFIREYNGEPMGRVACIRMIDEFMSVSFGPGL